jgi:N utilization substance protein B
MPLTKAELRARHRARARAVQALYAWDLAPRGTLPRTAERVFDDLAVPADERAFAEPLLRLVAEDGPGIDGLLAEATENWRFSRVGAVERAVLRLGAAELRRGEEPPRVVIQEAVILAERFGTARSARFVNGVLDGLARRLGAL